MSRFPKARYSFIIFFFGIAWLFPSCDLYKEHIANDDEAVFYNTLRQKASAFLDTNNDSCLFYADSALKTALRANFADTIFIPYYYTRGWYFTTNRQSNLAKENWEKLITEVEKTADSLLIAKYSLEYADVFRSFHELDKAEKRYALARRIYNKSGDLYRTSKALVGLAIISSDKGDFEGSQKYLIDASALLDKLDQPKQTSRVYLNIGNNFETIGSTEDAIKYTLKAYNAAMINENWDYAANALCNVGISYKTVDLDSALFYYKKALLVLKNGDYPTTENIINYNMANIYARNNDLEKAAAFYDSVMVKSKVIGLPEGVAMAYSGRAGIAEKKGNIRLANHYIQISIAIADSLKSNELKMAFMEERLRILQDNDRFKEAAQVSLDLQTLNDSIFSYEKKIAIHDMERKYQAEKKQIEIEHLKDLMTVKQKQSRLQLILGLIILIGLLVFGIFSFINYRLAGQKNKSYRLLISNFEEERLARKSISPNQTLKPEEVIAEVDHNESAILFEKLKLYFGAEKPWLDSGLKAEQVAERLSITYKILYTTLKENGNQTFNDFVNKYRVEAVIAMFHDPEYLVIKTEVISRKAGFGSRQAFYSAFEKVTGVKPGYYRKYLKDQVKG